ncbi:MAG: autotransporter-associated beta strand repeat-containing protein [Chthoniobacteraceae bacterium]
MQSSTPIPSRRSTTYVHHQLTPAKTTSRRLALVGIAAMLAAGSANAASITWSGISSSDGNWNTAANWSGSSIPGSTSATNNTDVATFNIAVANTWGSSADTPIVIDSKRNIGGIIFDAAAGSYFIGSTSGNSLYLTSSGTLQITSTLTNTSLVTETINAPLIIEGTYTITNNSSSGSGAKSAVFQIEGSITGGTTSAMILSLRGNNTNANTISGNISNGASTSLSVSKTDLGTWVLTGNNSFTGNVNIKLGILSVNSIADGGANSALGAGTSITLGQNPTSAGLSATGELLYTGATASSNRTISISNGANGGAGVIEVSNSSSTLTLSGAVTSSSSAYASSLTLQGAGNGVLRGSISGSLLSITKSGSGSWTLSGTNTYGGSTTISAGELDINGSISASSTVSIASGATLGGSGTTGGSVNSNGGTINGSGLVIGGAATLTGSSKLSGVNNANSVTIASGSTSLTGTTTSTNTFSVSVGATLNNDGVANSNMSVSGLLKGDGTVNGNLSLSGTLAPGDGAGIATINGNLTMGSTAVLAMDVTGESAGITHDQIKVSGSVTLAGTLDLSTLSGLTSGATITLIDNTSSSVTSGYFTEIITSGSTYYVTGSSSTYTITIGRTEYELNYASDADGDGAYNDVTLTVVPEPSTWAMLIGGIGLLAFAQKTRRF